MLQGILQILETEHGADRNKYEEDGGYVLIVEEDKDFEEIKNKPKWYKCCINKS